jgi:hypothetical protein
MEQAIPFLQLLPHFRDLDIYTHNRNNSASHNNIQEQNQNTNCVCQIFNFASLPTISFHKSLKSFLKKIDYLIHIANSDN